MKRIVIDARESGSTTGRYVDKLIEYLYGLQPEYEVILLAKAKRVEFFSKLTPSWTVIETPYKEFSFGEQLGFWWQIRTIHADLVFFPMVQQPILYSGRVVTTIQDLTGIRFDNPTKNPIIYWVKQQVYKLVIKQAAKKSAALMVPTQFVKDDVASYSGVNPEKITVTLESADPIPDKPEPIDSLVGQKFIMYVGRPTPHKNLERLIKAFSVLRKTHPELKLVLAGKTDGNYRRIEASVKQQSIKNVVFTDFVSEGQLRWLYEHCLAYIFPSLSEGFGLPGLEAMLHGAPVVSSNATCLPEVYGPAAEYFDPIDTSDIAKAIDKVLTDHKLRRKLIELGHKQVAKYSWQRMARQTLAVWREVLGD